MQDSIQRETLDVDILFVGGGPSSLSAAISLAQRIQKAGLEMPMIAVIEKAIEIGAHQISGAVLNPSALKQLFPNYQELGCPIEAPVTSEAVYFLTKGHALRAPIVPPPLQNHGNYVVSLSKFTRWLGERATELGINLFTGFTGVETLIENGRVVGVRTGDKGLDAKGNPKENFEAGVNIRAKCVVFGEGVRGFLSKQLIKHLKLDQGKHVATFETAVKEIWQCKPGTIKPGLVIHTAGYPLSNDTVGGSFIYGMKDDKLVVGMVVSLSYEDPLLEPYKELQKLKQHPLVAKMLEGGKSMAYGAKAIASGGYYAVPQLYFNGGLIIGESGALVDIARLKGIHLGMESGIIAAETIFNVLQQQKDFTQENLKPFQEKLLNSSVGKDLYRARNHHQALGKGMPLALIHLAAQQFTGGRGLIDPMPTKLDRHHYQTVAERYGSKDAPIPELPTKDFAVDKLTSVYNSGTLHEENQVPHLKIANFDTCANTCGEKYRSPCTRFCPANVYEMVPNGEKLRLQVNFTNCVHCQTCDIKCPEDNIRWTPPESGGGPRYEIV